MLDAITLSCTIQMKPPELIVRNALLAVVTKVGAYTVFACVREVLSAESGTTGTISKDDYVWLENFDLGF